MSVLITGGAGFLGSHLCDKLKGYDVIVLDDLSGGFAENVPKSAKLIVGNICNQDLVNSLFKKYKFEYVFHLAAYAAEGLSHFIRNFNYHNNLIGSINLINAAVNYGTKRFIFTSSMSVYGSQKAPFSESMQPSPEDPYAIAKTAVEKDLTIASDMFGLEYVIVRPHNVYGTRQNIWDKYRNVIGIFINQLLNDQPMTIFGDGEQVRAFSHIDDIISVLMMIMDKENANGEIFNAGGDVPIAINQLAKIVAESLGKEESVFHLPERTEVKVAYSSHDKIREMYGIVPKVDFVDGLKEMCEWAKDHYQKRQLNEFWNIEITKNLPSKWAAE